MGMKIFLQCMMVVAVLFCSRTTMAQDSTQTMQTVRIGIFAPLYLDSVFTGDQYRYDKNFPRFVVQGLYFVQGAQVAFDSMPNPYANIEATFFDSKSAKENLATLISSKKLDSLDLIIGAVQ